MCPILILYTWNITSPKSSLIQMIGRQIEESASSSAEKHVCIMILQTGKQGNQNKDGALLPPWINFKSIMDKLSHPQ